MILNPKIYSKFVHVEIVVQNIDPMPLKRIKNIASKENQIWQILTIPYYGF